MNRLGKLMLGAILVLPEIAVAEGLFSYPKSREALFEHQLEVIKARGGEQLAMFQTAPVASAKVQPVAAPVVAKRALRGRDIGVFLADAKRVARHHGVPEELFLALIQQESGWNKNARSSAGAIGLAQLMPGTAKDLRVNPHDPLENLEGGARYLRAQYETFGDWRLALAAYNAGPGAVKKHKGVPPYRETQNYVKRILGG